MIGQIRTPSNYTFQARKRVPFHQLMPTDQMTIAIIDKYPIVQSGIQLVLKAHIGITNILVSDGVATFYQKYKNEKPELIIISLSQQQGVSHFQTLGFLKQFYPLSPAILYDEPVETSIAHKYFQLGITGYVAKTDALTELIICAQKVINGGCYISTDVTNAFVQDISTFKNKDGKKMNTRLTSRENEIATYLVNGQKTSEIARNLQRKVSTISTIKASIFKKMKVSDILKLSHAISE